MQAKNIIFLEFEEAKQPIFKEKAGRDWITYGENDDYPEYLLDLFNNSAKHNAIIKGKVNYIVGSGFVSATDPVNRYGETANELLSKCTTDMEIYGGFYLEVIRKRGGDLEYIHTPYHKWRSNKDNTTFYYNGTKDKWQTVQKTKIVEVPAYDKDKPAPRSVIYFKLYRPGVDVYTLPDYIGALNYIEADKEVGKHTLNNAKSGFVASKMINLNDGSPTEEEQQKIEKAFKKKFTGSDGWKFVLSFNSSPEKAPTIADLGASDLTKEDFTAVNLLIQQEIFAGHLITSPMLFGIKTEGQLGGRGELRDAYEIFQNTYVSRKQKQLEKFFSTVLEVTDAIERVEPLSYQFSESVIRESISQEEVRKSFGKEPLEVDAAIQPIVDALSKLPASLAAKVVNTLDQQTILALIGKTPEPQPQPEVNNLPNQFKQDAQDAEVFSEFGVSKQDFVIVKSRKTRFDADEEAQMLTDFAVAVSEVEARILDLIRKDKRITVDVIAETLGLGKNVVENYIRDFESRGLLTSKTQTIGEDEVVVRDVTKEGSKAVTEQQPSTTEIFIRYSYEGPKDSRNRPFCARLMELDRLYSRADIEAISQRLGYSVWDRRGGWRTIKGTNEHVPYCRHQWVSNVVIKRK